MCKTTSDAQLQTNLSVERNKVHIDQIHQTTAEFS